MILDGIEYFPIPGADDRFLISRCGKVFNTKRNRHSKVRIYGGGGYLKTNVCLSGGKAQNINLHRLIAMAFIPRINGKNSVNHKNGIKTDNRVENLEWCTPKENTKHAWDTGIMNRQRVSETMRQSLAKILLNTETGIYYYGHREAAKSVGLTNRQFYSRIFAKRKTDRKRPKPIPPFIIT